MSRVEEGKPWEITNDNEAEWWIDKKQEELEEVERLEASIKDKIQMLEERLERVKEEKKYIEESRDTKLREYFEMLDPKQLKESKTQLKYRLPSGDLVLRKPTVEYKRDDDNLAKWLMYNGMNEYVEVRQKPKWSELKNNVVVVGDKVVIEDTGEIVEGVTVEEKPMDFKVKL